MLSLRLAVARPLHTQMYKMSYVVIYHSVVYAGFTVRGGGYTVIGGILRPVTPVTHRYVAERTEGIRL